MHISIFANGGIGIVHAKPHKKFARKALRHHILLCKKEAHKKIINLACSVAWAIHQQKIYDADHVLRRRLKALKILVTEATNHNGHRDNNHHARNFLRAA